MNNPVLPPHCKPLNTISNDAKDFHVSFNPDSRDYGCETTALVIGNHQIFFVIDGDHRADMKGSLSDCLLHVYRNADKLNNASDPVPVLWLHSINPAMKKVKKT